MINKRLEAALYYASLGWHIFPLAPGQKTPITSHGCKDGTTDIGTITKWWNQWPMANIGLHCGDDSGVYVVDVDVKPEANGFESLREFPALPMTVVNETPRHGAHFLFCSNVPPACRNDFRPGIDIRSNGYYIVLPPSTLEPYENCPNGGIYEWKTNQEPWSIPLASYPDCLRPSVRAPWTTVQTQQPAIQSNMNPANSDTLRRASLYLAQCDPAIQGQNGHNKLLWAAVALIHGFLLSDGETYELLAREYNPICVPPWNLSTQKDEKDFRRKITEARKLTPQHPEGWLLNDNSYAPAEEFCQVDIGSLTAQKKPAIIVSETGNPEIEYKFLISPPGLLGEICSWINSTALKEQPFLSVACALTFLGALFGRKVKDELGSRTNLYCMGVAPSSAGKAHAMNQLRRLAGVAGVSQLLGGDDIASDSAIEDRVSREPATIFLWDEIGHLLAHIKSGISQHHAQVVSLLMKLYSSAGNMYLGREYAEQQRQRTIVQPCCCIYGTSTMERFASGISPIELQDGWLSRCLVFQAPFDTPKRRDRIEQPVPTELAEKIRSWFMRQILPQSDKPLLSSFVGPDGGRAQPTQIIVPTDEAAKQIFIRFDNDTIEYGKRHPILACLWAKGEENARRIALIVACGNSYDNPKIDAAVADYACRLVKYIMLDFSVTIAPEIVTCEVDSRKRKLFKVIDKAGPYGILKRDVSRLTQEFTKKQRDDILSDLIESGTIAYGEVKLSKSKTYHYWTADNYRLYLEQCQKNQ